MKRFAALIKRLDTTNKTNVKVEALAQYFREASDKDKVWTIALLSHRRPPRPVNTTLLREYASKLANIPHWLFEESYHIVGDLAETIALVVPTQDGQSNKELSEYLEDVIRLKSESEAAKKLYLENEWLHLPYYERFVFTKLLTGGFRIGVSQKLMTRALSKAVGIDEDILAYKLMGNWKPEAISFDELVLHTNPGDEISKPYPFYLAYALEDVVEDLGKPEDWRAEHKWDGIRSQVIVRKGELFVWSRGEELVTDKFPEFEIFKTNLPNGTVLDGEILPFINGKIGSFYDLQTRVGRKNVSKKILESTPVVLKAYDLLEYEGKDIRTLAYEERRKRLDVLVRSAALSSLQLSEVITFNNWQELVEERETAFEKRSEGVMIKKREAPYQIGRKKGDWWKWKTDPLSVDAVLTYAMRGHGRRSNLFTDYTFALWSENKAGEKELVTFAKAYSGLTDKEFKEVDQFVKKHTLERFGPVRQVTPELVFEIGFEAIAHSKRHKSGIATRFPRILRWRKDKTIETANTLADLKALIP
jgi:DNA ligase-1